MFWHNLCLFKKFNHISCKFSPTSVTEVVDSLKKLEIIIYQNLHHVFHHEVEKVSLIPSWEEGRAAFANFSKMS